MATAPFRRRRSRQVNVGGIPIGGNAPIAVQSMTKTKTADVEATVAQILRCVDAGADIMRVTVNDWEAAEAIREIVRRSPIPIVADIHFNHIFALKAIEAGVAKVRINPGNIGSRDRIKQVLMAAKERGIPIRIGVNSGSLEKDILEKHGYPTAEALFESAMRHVEIANDFGFEDIVISVKSTDVRLMIEAYRMVAERTDYPLHLGVTEAGTTRVGTIKSAVGIGTLLAEGIGDTIRVSLTDEPEEEIRVGKEILRSLGLAQRSVELIACPTCGRIEVDLFSIVRQIEERVKGIRKPVKVALLGCVVNGPGEASEADIGIAAGRGVAILYRKGEVIRRVKEEEIVDAVVEEILNFVPEEHNNLSTHS
ncbi:MAG: flavodoxin-dependent (E)-4-hydroxy-3-methylbut-2-enyl-diphosphate synthase [Bacteroidota bacterium]|nr:flavodoxin-dependent (E)-4-hydroxy-3-methylbut-2-enyl-diphosphate synthase [Candidatus Kapabacteria bacterium]MCS7302418.1 flavodoxin-dependent (E)-4-hydroxy-3-methylbut-2-enyl-diphosphate synthase [Candidatus Kapabacteria bacterium]MCX7937108.1 flavodoxin-dependent (E)-4-hydroxy-3-methylbut-2-enyl-diphosphate synthase [Chlorobiota bacterium]MDW8074601.1 flavodoxin-dependent (E)-4-hydroxy-3-methylbut-2-enyl-diphosphate synthase [Bacteroidota bacterium]MDW8270923.1 flavodoxin-dependent (E)-4-